MSRDRSRTTRRQSPTLSEQFSSFVLHTLKILLQSSPSIMVVPPHSQKCCSLKPSVPEFTSRKGSQHQMGTVHSTTCTFNGSALKYPAYFLFHCPSVPRGTTSLDNQVSTTMNFELARPCVLQHRRICSSPFRTRDHATLPTLTPCLDGLNSLYCTPHGGNPKLIRRIKRPDKVTQFIPIMCQESDITCKKDRKPHRFA